MKQLDLATADMYSELHYQVYLEILRSTNIDTKLRLLRLFFTIIETDEQFAERYKRFWFKLINNYIKELENMIQAQDTENKNEARGDYVS